MGCTQNTHTLASHTRAARPLLAIQKTHSYTDTQTRSRTNTLDFTHKHICAHASIPLPFAHETYNYETGGNIFFPCLAFLSLLHSECVRVSRVYIIYASNIYVKKNYETALSCFFFDFFTLVNLSRYAKARECFP